MDIEIRPAFEPRAQNRKFDITIFIDVFRASSTSLAALESGAKELLISNDLEVLERHNRDGFLVISEVYDMGIDNSPTLVKKSDLKDRHCILKTSNLTTAIEANEFSGIGLIGCFNNLEAISSVIEGLPATSIEILPAGSMAHCKMNDEDLHCADVMKAYLEGNRPELNFPLLKNRISFLCEAQKRAPHVFDDLIYSIRPSISNVVPAVTKKNARTFDVRPFSL